MTGNKLGIFGVSKSPTNIQVKWASWQAPIKNNSKVTEDLCDFKNCAQKMSFFLNT